MSVFHANALIGASGADVAPAEFNISRSLRFNSGDTAYLDRTPSSAGNRRTWTWSAWVKQSDIENNYNHLFVAGTGIIVRIAENPGNNRRIHFSSYNGNSFTWEVVTTSELKDPSAWYHLVFVLDTTQATASDRAKIYVNGVLQTAFDTASYPSQNYEDTVNNTVQHKIGDYISGSASFRLDGYLAEVNFIDGQALAASDFGEYDDNNIWQAKAYSGTYGTNGFHLDFSDNTSTTTIAEDSSGNNNDWTAYNISVTSGADNDSLIDTPTNYTAVSGNNGGNYATLSPYIKGSGKTLSDGNLETGNSVNNNFQTAGSTIGMTPGSGKWYCEIEFESGSRCMVGINPTEAPYDTYPGRYSGDEGVSYHKNGNVYYEGAVVNNFGSTYAAGDIIGIAYDATASTNQVEFFKNGTSQGTRTVDDTKTYHFAAVGYATTDKQIANFGQRPFVYTPPTGHKALCTTNLPDPTIADPSAYMDVVLYTGNGSTQSISGLSFSPDLVWYKVRSATNHHILEDTIRGAGKFLATSQNNKEGTSTNTTTSFNSDGVSIGNNSTINTNTSSYVAWFWDAGASTATNTDGSTTSSVRANPTSGFSIVTYTGTGANATVGHGLNAAPQVVIVKDLSAGYNWQMAHSALGADVSALPNTTTTPADYNAWNNTRPTSSVFSLGSVNGVNRNGNEHIAFCFSAVESYSSIGSYDGNGDADGPFIYTGMRPAWIVIRRSNSTGNWIMVDNKREGYNQDNEHLLMQSNGPESTSSFVNIFSDGFRITSTDTNVNASGSNYLYIAFAEYPFKTGKAR